MKKIITTSLFLLVLVTCSFGQADAFSKDVLHFLEINGSKQTFSIVVKQLIQQFKLMKSDVPADFWDEFEKEILTTSMDDLYKELVPVYQKHFTHAEIKKIIAFYESDAGRKMAQETPTITQESMSIGQKWGRLIGERIQKKLQEKGY